MSLLAGLRYEFRLHFRSLVFWIAVALLAVMVYSEVVVEMGHLPEDLRRAQANPELLQRSIDASSGPGKARLQQILEMSQHGPGPDYYQDMAGIAADRMSIALSFAALFVAGFAPQRDRSAGNRELAYSSKGSSLRFVLQQYLGALGSLLVAACVGTGMTLFQFWRVQAQAGGTWTLSMLSKPLLLMVVPTVAYAAALLLCASVVIGQPTALVPLYFLYFYATFRPVKVGAEVTFPLNLGTFIVRWDGHGMSLFGPEYPALVQNRVLYLGLTVGLLAATALAYSFRRRAFSPKEVV